MQSNYQVREEDIAHQHFFWISFSHFLFSFFSGFQTPESKKQEFRRYLEKSGVIDALTKGNPN